MGKDHSIVVDPEHQFGSPIIEGTNIKVSTLASLGRGGETVDFISKMFNLTTSQVDEALRFAKAA